MTRTAFPWKYWWWTNAHENLFELSRTEYNTFKLLVEAANKE